MRTSSAQTLILVLTGLILACALDSPAAAQGSGSSRLSPPTYRPSPTAAPSYRQPYPTSPQPPLYRQPYPISPQPPPVVVRPPTPEEFSQSLWRFLVRPQAPYTSWPALPGKDGLRPGESPHGPPVRLYANATATADPKGLPPGSVLVLEDYAADRKTRTGINILYRVQGYDPRNGDWYWLKYNEDGTIVRTAPADGAKAIAGRVQTCIDCHRKAGGDLVFSNDPAVGTTKTEPVTK